MPGGKRAGLVKRSECLRPTSRFRCYAAVRRSVAIASAVLVCKMACMDWTAPSCEEIKMDAEIGSYQEDYEPLPVGRRSESTEEDRAEE